MTTFVALLRGINVGKAKRIAMVDLRALMTDLGFREVRTLLNSGNVVCTGADDAPSVATQIERGIVSRFAFGARVIVRTADELAAIVANDPVGATATDPSRYLVAFLDAAPSDAMDNLVRQDWAPELVTAGIREVYVWSPDGLLASRALEAIGRIAGDGVTVRNWATVRKLHAMLSPEL
jgi:uncharacterized protein (DUF1697 family)